MSQRLPAAPNLDLLKKQAKGVLRLSRHGRASIAEIAVEVHLAPGTVRNRLSTAMSKLGAPMRHAAAHRAWEQGWI